MYEQDREGLSGLRVMEGEDLAQGNRVRRQQLQQKDWLDQQTQLKSETEKIAKENQDMYEMQEKHFNDLLKEGQEREEAKRKSMMKAMMDENIRLAKTKKDLEKYNAHKNMVSDKYDLTSAENDPFLNEHFTTTRLKDEHIAKIVREREMQLKEAELKKQQEKEERRLWSIQEEHLRRLKIKQDRLLKKNNRAMQEAALAHQLDQNKENKIRWKDPYGDRS